MKTIIAGSRNITNYVLVKEYIEKSGINITTVLCGEAKGVDTIGKQWAIARGIPVESYPADWERYGKSAGPIRNKDMLWNGNAEAAIIIRNAHSAGSEHMAEECIKKKVQFPNFQLIVYILPE